MSESIKAWRRPDAEDIRQHRCLASNGVDILVLKELLGHKTLAMTMRYSHLFPDHGRKAVDRLSAIYGVSVSQPGTQAEVPIQKRG